MRCRWLLAAAAFFPLLQAPCWVTAACACCLTRLQIALARMCGRRTDPVTGKIYHMLYAPPPNDPEVRKRLVHRSDDSEEKGRVRLASYHKNMDDAVNWYPREKLVIVDSTKDEDAVYRDLRAALDPVFRR
jgi:adenylate kinase